MKWSQIPDADRKWLLAAYREAPSLDTVLPYAAQFDIKPHTLLRRLQEMNAHNPEPVEHQPLTDNARDMMEQYLGTSLVLPERMPRKKPGRTRIVAVGDLHGSPDPELIAEIIRLAPDEIYIGGDVFHQEQVSPHGRLPKETLRLTLRQEMANCRAALELLLRELPASIHIMRGNHDDWISKLFTSLVPEALLDFFTDPLDLLISGLPRTEMVVSKWRQYYPSGADMELGESRYMCVVGDAFLSHGNFTGKWPGDAVQKLSLWLARWRRTLGLPDLSLLVQFHGHKCAHLEDEGSWQTWIEPGMAGLPSTESYKMQYKGSWSPGVIGAVYFEQEQGRTDRSSIRLIRPHRA